MAAQTPQLKVTLFVLTWNGQALLARCLPRLAKQTYPNCRVVIIDNASTDDSGDYVTEQFPQFELIANEKNLGFSQGINIGLRTITDFSADHLILLLNNDVYVEPTWLAEMVAAWQAANKQNDIGVAGCQLRFPDGSIQHVGGKIDRLLAFSHHLTTIPEGEVVDVDYVTGAAFIFSAETLQQVGQLDQLFSPFYYEEVDYCYRVRAAGKRVIVFPHITAIHDESASVSQVSWTKSGGI